MIFPNADILLPSIYQLTPSMLTDRGVSLLLMDLDNTLAPYSADLPNQALCSWIDSMRAGGVELFILSNNRGLRPEVFGQALRVDYVNRAKKPRTQVLFQVLDRLGKTPQQTAIVGDQVYTDVLCGSRAGLTTVAVRPLSMKNPFFALRYALELPFRQKKAKKILESWR